MSQNQAAITLGITVILAILFCAAFGWPGILIVFGLLAKLKV